MQGFKEAFEAYGADYTETMNRFVNNETLYLKLLSMLFEDDSLRQLGGALERKDWNAAFEAAHALKGVVGNMGLTPLYKAVCRIVEPLRNGEERDDYSLLYQAVCEEFKKAEEWKNLLKEGNPA